MRRDASYVERSGIFLRNAKGRRTLPGGRRARSMGSCRGAGRALSSWAMAPAHRARSRDRLALFPLALGAVLLACQTVRPTQPPRTLGPFTSTDEDDPDAPTTPPLPHGDADDETECTTAADCVITNFTDCCACCECAKPPYAISHKKLHTLEAKCATVDCSMEGCNTKRCPPCTTPTLKPDCDDGTCVAR